MFHSITLPSCMTHFQLYSSVLSMSCLCVDPVCAELLASSRSTEAPILAALASYRHAGQCSRIKASPALIVYIAKYFS